MITIEIDGMTEPPEAITRRQFSWTEKVQQQ